MTHSDKILQFADKQKFIMVTSAALLIYGSKEEAKQKAAFSLIKSLTNQKKLREAISKYKTPKIYIIYKLTGSKRKSPLSHGQVANECAARHAYNSQFNRKGEIVKDLIIPTFNKHSDFYDLARNLYFEFDTGAEDYQGDRQIKAKLLKYGKDDTIVWICTADQSEPTDQLELSRCQTILGFVERFKAEFPAYRQSHYVIPLRKYLAGELNQAQSHSRKGGTPKIYV